MEQPSGIYGIQLLASHLRLLPERDRHAELFRAMEVVIEHLCEPEIAGPLMVRFELRLLEELGFGLDLSACAGTGRATTCLCVAEERSRRQPLAGEPWKDKLLALPAFLGGSPRSCRTDGDGGCLRVDGLFPAPPCLRAARHEGARRARRLHHRGRSGLFGKRGA
jgi:DNA repair protein RecO (recombination protein O)